jgi:peptidoglycan biosynthesis protein MviN/MurJ (putative lipid II flippase)
MLWQVAAGNLLMVAFLWWVAGDTQRWIELDAWSRVQWMTLLVVGGAGIYCGTMYVLGMRVHELRVRTAGPARPSSDRSA